MQGYLKYFSEKGKLEQIDCKSCKMKGHLKYRDYYQCKYCGFTECLKHKESMKKCRCRCLECFREIRRDFYGRMQECRCVTSEAYIR